MRAGAKRSKPAATAVCVVKRLPARVTARATSNGCPLSFMKVAGALQHGERRMPFVQVADFRLDAQRLEQAATRRFPAPSPAAAATRARPVKLAGDAAVSREVGGVIAVQQVQLHPATWTCQARSQTE